jgi:hypothetical protein
VTNQFPRVPNMARGFAVPVLSTAAWRSGGPCAGQPVLTSGASSPSAVQSERDRNNADSPRSLSGGAAGSRALFAHGPRSRIAPAPLGGGGPSIVRGRGRDGGPDQPLAARAGGDRSRLWCGLRRCASGRACGHRAAAASDWAAARLAVAIERVAAALLVEDESSHSIMRAHELQRMRP